MRRCRRIDLRLRNYPVQNALQPDVEVKHLEGVDTFLKPFGNGKVPRFYCDSVIALCCVLGY